MPTFGEKRVVASTVTATWKGPDLAGATQSVELGELAWRDELARLAEARRLLLDPTQPYLDLLTVLDQGDAEVDRVEAAQRLAHGHFSRGRIFHPERWALIDRAFNHHQGERSARDTWVDLAVPHLLSAVDGLPEDATTRTIYRDIRSYFRKAIERELLGRTSDAGDPVRRLAMDEHDDMADALALADLRLDALRAIAGMPRDDWDLLVAYHREDADRDDLALRLGVSNQALRQRIHRLRAKLT